jgi:hypothetical protein
MRLTFDRLWIWIAIALPAFVALLVPLPAVDLAYQVRAGNEILASGALPVVDSWTFTVAGTAWMDQQWLAQILLALGHRVGGWELLAGLRAALVASLTGQMVAVALMRGAAPRTAAILALAAFALAAPALALRPQLFGLVIWALLLWLVAVRDRRPRAFLLAPVLVLLWANLHGSFVLGPAILAYVWLDDLAAGRPWRRSFAVLAAGVVATLINPFGLGVWAYAAGIGANPAIAGQVSEWQRTAPLAMPGILFYPSVVITLGLMAWRRSSLGRMDWFLLAGMVALGAWAVRGVAWWAPVMVFLLAGLLQAGRPVHAPRRSLVNGVTAAVLAVLIVMALPWWRPSDPLTGRVGLLSYAPSGLAARVAELAGPGMRVVVPQTWGSWFEWAAPDAKYFIDSRFELFPADVWADYAALIGPAKADGLDGWAVDEVVVPAGGPIPSRGWRQIYADVDGSILVRAP